MHTAIGRSLVVAVATSLCFISASYALPAAGTATTAGKPLVLVKAAKAKTVSKKSARLHRSERKTAKVKANEKVAPKPPIANNEAHDGQTGPTASAALPPQVANAHAEFTTGDLQSSESPSTLTEADKTAAAETASNGVQIAAADQLNDIDRDLASQMPASTTPVQTAALADGQSTTVQNFISQGQGLTGQGWNGATWIGKIFIGLGAMLTLASAARMLIA